MRAVFLLLLVLCFPAFGQSFDERMLTAARPYLPLLAWAYDEGWPTAPIRSVAAAQIEKESRWNPTAELCVPRPSCSREHGIGLGQFTITPRFNAFQEMTGAHPLLAGWHPKDYRDPKRQTLAIVLKNKGNHRSCAPMFEGAPEVMACVTSAYNGGLGGVIADRRLCGNTAGCNPKRWFGHVENTSLKAKTALQGYGQSFFQINRSYATGTVLQWRHKYVPILGS